VEQENGAFTVIAAAWTVSVLPQQVAEQISIDSRRRHVLSTHHYTFAADLNSWRLEQLERESWQARVHKEVPYRRPVLNHIAGWSHPLHR